MNERDIRRVAVIGSGVMGRQLAAMLANAGVQVELLDIVPGDAGDRRSRLAEEAVRALPKMKPPPLVADEAAGRIRPGNLKDHWDRVLASDWVLEAVVERLDIKRRLFARMDVPDLRAAWVTTNTSGLSLEALAEGRSDTFRRRFFGTHFFNPPRYLPLVEIVPQSGTDPDTAARLVRWLERRAGKRPVAAKDTPNFIANRLGVFQTLVTLRLMERYELTVEEVDALTGLLLGRPKSATFQTLDLVGLDIFAATLNTLRERARDDEFYDWFVLPEWLEQLLEAGRLGRKTRQGVYWKKGDELLVYDPGRGDYRPRRKPSYPWWKRVMQEPDLPSRLAWIRRQEPRLADFLLRQAAYSSIYAARRVPEIADAVVDVDCAVRWGFQARWGPFQVWDQFDGGEFRDLAAELPDAPAPLLDAMDAAGATKFYRLNDRPHYFRMEASGHVPSPDTRPWSAVEWVRSRRQPVRANAEASLYDLGDGVYALFWHAPNHAIGLEILEMVQRSLDYVDAHGRGLVITGAGDHFSYGANLGLLVMALQNRDVARLDWTVRTFQHLTKSLRAAPFPVVAAVHGLVLGGGCEFMLHADAVVAASESYIGLVELGAGLIPAGGGCTEIVRRANEIADTGERVVPWVHVQDRLGAFFRRIARAEVSRSAREAQQWGYLREGDRILPDPDRRLAHARARVLELAEEYVPAEEPEVWVTGPDGFAQFMFMVHSMHRAGYITDYERVLGERLCWVLTGGDVAHPTRVPLDAIRDLEREAFLRLCKERKTYERIAHIIAFGKPLRN